jgi:Uma2 family endonuclease
MSSAAPSSQPLRMSPEEYLTFERAADMKHEYVDGEVRAMSGASLRHVTIVANLTIRIGEQVRGRGCRVLTSDMRVMAPGYPSYLYPDLAVVCGAPVMGDDQFDILTNPTLLIEVLSPSSSNYDRGEKWEKYRRIESLREYLVVSQDRAHVERYTRQGERFWLLSEAAELAERVELESIGCTLTLSEIYEQVAIAGSAEAPDTGAGEAVR